MTPTLANVKKVAAKLGATVIRKDDECNIEAPQGHVWSGATDIHESVGCANGYSITEVYAGQLDFMSYGVEPCEIPDCEWCRDTAKEMTNDRCQLCDKPDVEDDADLQICPTSSESAIEEGRAAYTPAHLTSDDAATFYVDGRPIEWKT